MQQLNQISIIRSKTPGNSVGVFIVCLILSIVAIFLLLLPKYHAYTEAKDKVVNAQKIVDDLKKQEAGVLVSMDKLSKRKNDLNRLDEAVPSKPGIPEMYAYIEGMAKSLNLDLVSMSGIDEAEAAAAAANGGPGVATGPATAVSGTGASQSEGAGVSVVPGSSLPIGAGPLGVITFAIKVDGRSTDFIGFLGKLQNSLRLIDVQSIDIDGGDKNGTLSFMINFKTYYQRAQ